MIKQDYDKVICPGCMYKFVGVPENVRDRIAELEKCGEHRQDIIEILEQRVEELETDNQRLREAGATIISAIRFGLSQDELEAMEEFELLLGGGEK